MPSKGSGFRKGIEDFRCRRHGYYRRLGVETRSGGARTVCPQTSKTRGETVLLWTSMLTSYKAMQHRLRYIQLDYGRDGADSGFISTLKREDRMSTLRIHKCLYEGIFRAEGKSFLLRGTCCEADEFWLSSTSSRSFTGGLASSKARGDPECVFYVAKK